ncbi:MAG: amidohydrolase family protein [Phycisphaerales bacterium]
MTRSVTHVAGALAALAAALVPSLAPAQPTSNSPLAPPTNGPKHADPDWYAIVGATVHVSPDETYEQATVVIRGGRIVSVQAAVTPRGDGKPNPPAPPAGARVFDATGLHVYPGLIDAYVEVDAPKPDPNSPGLHWNSNVTPQRWALDGPGLSESDKKDLREQGFVAAAIAPKGGVFRGMGAVVSLAPNPDDDSLGEAPVYNPHAFHTLGFDTSGFGDDGGYPTSHMGVMALFRQTLMDAKWEKSVAGTPLDTAPSALTPLHAVHAPLLFDADDPLEALLAARIQREQETGHILVVGGGAEYQRLDPIAAMDATLILPLRDPKAPDVSSIGKMDSIDLDRLMAWEQAPTNTRRLVDAGATVCLTTSKLPRGQKFSDNLRKAIEYGLSERDALAALTTNPAAALGVSNTLGTIASGKVASLVVTDGDLFDKDTKILDVWVDGQRQLVNEPEGDNLAGTWDLVIDNALHAKLVVTDKKGKASVKVLTDDGVGGTTEHEAGAVSADEDSISFSVKLDALAGESPIIFSGVLSDGALSGAMMRPAGAPAQWRATRAASEPEPETSAFEGDWTLKIGDTPSIEFSVKGDTISTKKGDTKGEARDVSISGDRIAFLFEDEAGAHSVTGVLADDEIVGKGTNPDGNAFAWIGTRKADETKAPDVPDLPGYPFGPYALKGKPEQPDYLVITGATVWTSAADGVLKPADYQNGTLVVVKKGKIDYVGPNKDLRFPGDANIVRVDATGMHLTPGIIDCHSHTGLFRFGVNESGQAVTSECWIGDALDPGFIGFYRELAGGVTAANLLHGSANPIGGKNQVVKLRWGAQTPDEMFFEGAKPGIKFALGENVKQSNWGDNATTRYPQTRMGVETLIRDRFQAAKEYMERWDAWEKQNGDGATKRQRDAATKGGFNGEGENIPRPDRMAERNGAGQIDLSGHIRVAGVGTLRADLADAPGGRVSAVEHRRGTRSSDEAGLSPHAQDRSGLSDGALDSVRAGGLDVTDAAPPADRGADRGDRPSPSSADSIAGAQDDGVMTPVSLRRSVAPSLLPPRRDLELEALAQILKGERLIHCHSYRQDEILMLCRVAEDFGFKIGTFQHGLEVYKVADVVKKDAIGASIFADWWAYKVEVQDAIPYAGPLETEVGVLTSYNSDDDDLARRLNLEAAKAVKYSGGKITPEQALRFVTINPAIQLAIDDRVGSIEVGKDADLVLWNAPPLSTTAKAASVWIDGRLYFSLDEDKAARRHIASERERLVAKLLADDMPSADKDKGDERPTGRRGRNMVDSPPRHTLLAGYIQDALEHAAHPQQGECGCNTLIPTIYFEKLEMND